MEDVGFSFSIFGFNADDHPVFVLEKLFSPGLFHDLRPFIQGIVEEHLVKL